MELITPGPLSSVAGYTPERLEERADYADARLTSTTRVPTPNIAKLLTLYKNACMEMHLGYETLSRADLAARAEEIRGYDQDLSEQEWMRDNPDSTMPDEVLKLRKLVYWARYGDYAAHMASQLRKKAGEDPKTAFAEKISGQFLWTDISAQLKREERAYNKTFLRDESVVPTIIAVHEARGPVGIDVDAMIRTIHLYADRNAAFHRSLKEMLKAQEYLGIAKIIFDDLKDLGSICSPAPSDDEAAIRALLEQLRDEGFETSFNSDKPESQAGYSRSIQCLAEVEAGHTAA